MHATAQAIQAPATWKHSGWQEPRRPATARPRTGEPLPLGTLTEVFCQRGGLGQLRLLVPALAQLSHQHHKWITFIAPPCLPNAGALARAGVDTTKIQVVHTRSVTDYWATLEEVLSGGHSSAVLAWPPSGEFDDEKRGQLKRAASRGETVAFMFRQLGVARQESTAEPVNDRQLALAL